MLRSAIVHFSVLLVWIGGGIAVAQAQPAAGRDAVPGFVDLEVAFDSTAEGIRIAGTLSVPSAAGPHPAVLMITGNGPHTRDQMISNTPMFKMLGEFFARQGFVVLRTDARGHGSSTGPDDWEQNTTADRVEDNRAALEFLRKRSEVDPDRVVLFGHSEGAMIAVALAAGGADPALSILLSPSTLPGDEVVAGQMAGNLVRRGASPEVADAVRRQFLRFAEFLVDGGDDDREFERIALDFLAAHGVEPDKLDPEFARSLIEGYRHAPWYLQFFALDPADDLAKLDTPVLAVFAGHDENVPWRQHLPALVAARARGGSAGTAGDDLTIVVLPDQDHFFLEFEGRRLDKHEPGKMRVADELLRLLESELARRRPVE